MEMKVTLKPLSEIIFAGSCIINMDDDIVTNIIDKRNGWCIGKDMIRKYWKDGKRVIKYSGPLDITKSFSFGGYAFSSHWVESVEPIAPETRLINIGSRVYEVDTATDGKVFTILKSYQRR